MHIRKRQEVASNYSAVFINGKTIRIPIDPSKPIGELKFPEFYDIGINSVCKAKCPWCYTSATPKGKNFTDLEAKIQRFFGAMSPNERPFQVAIGGSGEPTIHPDFRKVLKAFKDLGIVPNYTTNGMHLTKDVIGATQEYCGGTAVSLHPHLQKTWEKALLNLHSAGIKTNVHIVVSGPESIEQLDRVYNEFQNIIDYFVLLPHMNVGFAATNQKTIDYDTITTWLQPRVKAGNIAFGSNMYDYLLQHPEFGTSLYPPELLSKYLVMDDDMQVYANSFVAQT